MNEIGAFNSALARLMSAPRPEVIIVAPGNAAMFQACLAFQGRDRRRIKREMNKAWKKAQAARHGR